MGFDENDKITFTKPTDIPEIRALVGLFYLCGALKQNLHSAKDLFYHDSSCDVFAATMNYRRFYFLCQKVQFDEKETRGERWRMDLFTALRNIFESFNVNCATLRIPSEYLAIDEILDAYRGLVKLKQYNPNKPAKYGLLYRSISDSVVPYTYFTLTYAGKPETEGSEFYVTGTDEYSVYLVDKLSSHVDITGRNVSMDRYFTCVAIAHYLKEKKMMLVGTMRADRKGIPKELVEIQNRDDKDIKFVYPNEDNMMLTYHLHVLTYVDISSRCSKENIRQEKYFTIEHNA